MADFSLLAGFAKAQHVGGAPKKKGMRSPTKKPAAKQKPRRSSYSYETNAVSLIYLESLILYYREFTF